MCVRASVFVLRSMSRCWTANTVNCVQECTTNGRIAQEKIMEGGSMQSDSPRGSSQRGESFVEALSAYSRFHRAQHWSGTFGEFLRTIVPGKPAHWRAPAMNTYGTCSAGSARHRPAPARAAQPPVGESAGPRELFKRELFGIDEPLEPRRRLLQGRGRGLRRGPTTAAAARAAVRRQVDDGDPAQARARGVQPHRRRRAVRAAGLADARVAAESDSRQPARRVPRRPTASTSAASCQPVGARAAGARVRGRLPAHARSSACSCPRLRASASALMRRTIRRPPTSPTSSARSTCRRSPTVGDEGDPRAWSWSGAVYAASRGVLEMIEILKVKREFLYLLLTLTQEKNVKVSRFPLIHLDETILAHTNLAEFHKFLQEKENEALLDRMVIVKVPYTLSFRDEARIYASSCPRAPAFRDVHLDPHALRLGVGVRGPDAAAEAGARRPRPHEEAARSTRARASRASPRTRCTRLRAESPDEGLTGVSPRFVDQRDLERDHAQRQGEPHQHGNAARAQGRDRERRAHGREAEEAVDRLPGAGAQGLLQPLGQGRRPSRAVRVVRGRGAAAAGEVSGRSRGLARPARGRRIRSRASRARRTSASCARSRRRSRSPSRAS